MSNFPLTNMAVKMFCPDNVVQLDDAGLPSLLVYIPAFKNSDVLNGGDDSTHPAFIVNGKEIDGFYYSKYQNVVYNGKAYSLPAEDPQTNISFDQAREYCEAKGYGWHLSTAAEWAAIALWCFKNGFMPNGNNSNGKDVHEAEKIAIPMSYNNDGNIARVATGTGPIAWSHDNSASGIWDMNGNVWEWQSGIRLVWGELQILANNDAADPDNPQNTTSTCWKAINAADGSLVEPECTVAGGAVLKGNTVRIDYVLSDDGTVGYWTYVTEITNATTGSRNSSFEKLTCTDQFGEAAKVLLRALALLPDQDVGVANYRNDRVWWTNGVNECSVYRGGSCDKGAYCGVFCISGAYSRSNKGKDIGFRAAYIPNI